MFRWSIQADDLLDEIRLINPSFKVVPGHSLLSLDEIQTYPDARAAIKPLVQDGRVDFIADLGFDMTAIEVKSGSNRASRSFNRIRTDPRYSQYPITRFIRLSPGNILVDGNGVEHYLLFAAAFMDSMYEAQKVDCKGYEPLDLRIGPDPRRRG